MNVLIDGEIVLHGTVHFVICPGLGVMKRRKMGLCW